MKKKIHLENYYSNNQKTVVQEDDIKAKINYILCCYKANSFTSNLLSENGLFRLHNGCV